MSSWLRNSLMSAGTALLFASNTAYAAKPLDFTIHQEYVSTRALGMGNAFTAVADDHSAMFYNPAALARRKDGQVRMFLRAGIDDSYLDLVDQLDEATSRPEGEQVEAINDVIVNNYGETFYSRVPTLGGVWVRPGWGIGFIPADLSIDLGIHRQVGPMMNVNAYLDTTLAFSYATDWNLFGADNRFSIGMTVKALHRVYGGYAVSAGELASDGGEIFDTSDAAEGLTIDADIGTMFTPQVPTRGALSFLKYMKPTFAFVVRNVADYGFAQNLHLIDENSKEPPKLQRRFDFGSNWDLPNFWVFDPHFALDVRDVGHENWTMVKGLHAGAELYWKMFNWWKGSWSMGINQGYWTAGFGARFAWFQLDLATWGEEVGTKDVQIESRRYMVEMSLDF